MLTSDLTETVDPEMTSFSYVKTHKWKTEGLVIKAGPRRWFLADWEAVKTITGLARVGASRPRTCYP